MIFDKSGNLYGTTQQGGPAFCGIGDQGGCGMVFELSPGSGGTWTETTLHEFTGGDDGGSHYAGELVMDSAGNLFGANSYGGVYFFGGAAFELSPGAGGNWTFNVIHSFDGVDGDPQLRVLPGRRAVEGQELRHISKADEVDLRRRQGHGSPTARVPRIRPMDLDVREDDVQVLPVERRRTHRDLDGAAGVRAERCDRDDGEQCRNRQGECAARRHYGPPGA